MQENNTLPALPETFKPEVFKNLIDQAPGVYIKSKSRVNKAIEIGKKIISEANAEKAANGKISPEMDARLNKHMVNIRGMLKEINEARTPITQMFNQVVKLYTGLESEVDPKNVAAPAHTIQKLRDEYATVLAQEEKRRQEEAARKMAKDKEAVDLRISIEKQLLDKVRIYTETCQMAIVDLFESYTLENFNEVSKAILDFNCSYPFTEFAAIKPYVTAQFHTPEEVTGLIAECRSGKHAIYDKEHSERLEDLKDGVIAKLPSKRVELEEAAEAKRQKEEADRKAKEAAEAAAKASAEEKARLDAEAAEANKKAAEAAAEQKRIEDEKQARQKEESEKLAADNKAKADAEAAKLETERAAGHANTLFSTPNLGPMGLDIPKPQVREGYEITVKHPLGYQVIAAFYFEKEGKNEPIDKLEGKTLGAMRKFAEAYAQKNGEKITSPYLEYKEVYKSVNRK